MEKRDPSFDVPVTPEFIRKLTKQRRYTLSDLAGICYALAIPQNYYFCGLLQGLGFSVKPGGESPSDSSNHPVWPARPGAISHQRDDAVYLRTLRAIASEGLAIYHQTYLNNSSSGCRIR